MSKTLISNEKIVLKKDLLNMGFEIDELCMMIDKKLLKPLDESCYYVHDIPRLKQLSLKKLLEFDWSILTIDDLDYLDIEPVDRMRLISYRVLEKIDDERLLVIDNVDKIKILRPEIDLFLYKRLYKDNFHNKNLILAHQYLSKYIKICEALNIEGNYYYKLADLKCDIRKSNLDFEATDKYCSLRKKYRKSKNKKNYKVALSIAKDCYNLNSGSIEATKIAEAMILLGHGNNSKILYFLNEAIKKNPTNPLPYKYLATMYLKMNMPKEAVLFSKRYISLDKNTNCDGYIQLFHSHLINNDLKEAHSVFNRALYIIPSKNLESFVKECILVTKQYIAKQCSKGKGKKTRLNELNALYEMLLKEVSIDFDDIMRINEEEQKYKDFEDEIEELIRPNEFNIVSLNKVDSYISDLNISNDEKNIMLLRASLVLAKNNYIEKSNSFIIKVERSKDKNKEVVEQLKVVRSKIKLLNKGI